MGSGEGLGGLQTHFRMLLRFLAREGCAVGAIVVCDELVEELADNLAFVTTIPHSSSGIEWGLKKASKIALSIVRTRQFNPTLFIAAAIGGGYCTVSRSISSTAFSFYHEICADLTFQDPLRLKMKSAFHAVAAQSQAVKSSYQQQISGAKPLEVLPCFARPPAGDTLAKVPCENELLKLGYFGRLAANKGLSVLLSAWSTVGEKLLATLDIYGQGPEKAVLERQIEALQLSSHVKLWGEYPDGEAFRRLLTSCHGLVLPSTGSEGLPLILLEAMSCGLPFLATGIGGIPDAAHNNSDAIIVECDAASLAQGLITFTSFLHERRFDPSRQLKYYEANFGVGVIEEQWRVMLKDPRGFFQ